MSTGYPTSLDAFTRPNPGDPLALSNGKSQTQILDDVQDAVEAIEAKVGVTGSAIATTIDYALANLVLLKSLLDTKGDLIVATGDNTPARVPVGANNEFIVADSGQAAGLKWAGGATARTALGLGTMATASAAAYLPLLAAGAAVEDAGAIESRVNTVAATGATETLDTALYAIHDCTMDVACTFTFSNPAPSGQCSTFALILRGAFTPTLPASIRWADGTPPAYATPTLYVFQTVNGGAIWFGSRVGKAFA